MFLFRDPEPTPFYSEPENVPDNVGTVINSEPYEGNVPANSQAWRIMYVTTDDEGESITATGLIVAPEELPDEPTNVLVWAHGTTGVDTSCAPSVSDNPLFGIPDLDGAIEEGWVIAMPDYVGLGTDDDHPYLVGDITARAALDSARAVHDFDEDFNLTDDYAIWGHSQGGHAALFAGNHAEDYLPDLNLVGVVALAPATYLDRNLETLSESTIGNILQIYAASAWSNYYPEIDIDILADEAQDSMDNIVSTCMNSPAGLRLILDATILPNDVISRDVNDDPDWSARTDENSVDPDGSLAPTFVGQGADDDVISADITHDWVRDRCDSAAPTTWVSYSGVDHVGVINQGGDDGLEWTIDRFAGETFSSTCPAD